MIRPVIAYFQDSFAELRHVSWPSRAEVVRNTAIIIVSVAIAMVVIAMIDYGLDLLVTRFIIR